MDENQKEELKNENNNPKKENETSDFNNHDKIENKVNENIQEQNIKYEKLYNNITTDSSISFEIIKDELAQYDMNFKLIILGDSYVGKSCISANASKNIFEEYYSATVGFEFFSLYYKINSKTIRLQIWDTCGQEEYKSLIQNFYRNSSLAILVYSIDNKDSFENLEIWLNEIKTKGNPDVKIFLVGNKIDLEEKRVVSTEEGEEFYKNNNLSLFLETSAKNGKNIQELFKKAAILLYQEHNLYINMAYKQDNVVKLPQLNNEESNILENDEISVRKKCC